MRVLLDECVPVQVRNALQGHHVQTAQEMGWAGFDNGNLIGAAENASFDILVVADKNLRYQQNLATRRIAIVELWTNHRPTLETQFERIAAAVNAAVAGSYTKA